MRFRYFDSEGTEVELSSVDALKFRMSTGAITPETLLYDAAVGKWAPAGRHQVYRFLVEEEDDLLPEASRAMWEELDDGEPVTFTSDPGEARSDRDPELPSNPDRRKRPSGPGGAPEPAAPATASPRPEPDVSAFPGPELPSDPDRRERTSRPSRKEEMEDPEGEEGENGKAPAKENDSLADLDGIEPLAEGEELDSAGPDPTEDPPRTRPSEETDSTVQDGSAGPNRLTRRPSSHPGIREVDIPARLVSRSTASGDSGSESAGSGSGDPHASRSAGGSRRMRWSVLAALLLFGGGAVLVHLMEARPDVLAAVAADTSVESTGPMSSVVSMVTGGTAGTAVHRAGAGSGEDRARPGAGDEMESLVSEVGGAVSLDLARAMTELQEALGVTERPPEAWLHGAYLARADRHPQVREYWRAYGAYVTSVRALEEELYRGFVQNRVLKMGLDTASAAGLSARVLERYERSAEKRETVYDDLAALAGEALALHDTLAYRSESISYEPFSGRSLSRDPVVEAMADDPELAEHIWSRMDRIFELLDRIQGVQPVSTLRLQDALLSGLRIPEREG